MALVKCKKCKKKISENANICPNCGYEITKEKRREYINNIKSKIPKKVDILVLIFIISIVFGIILGKIINYYKTNSIEEYFYEDSENSYYLKLDKDSQCEFEDSLRGKLNCNYEVVRMDEKELVQFKLILSFKDDQELYTYYNCYRQVNKSSETRGSYNLIHCSNDIVNYEDEFTLYTK